MAAPPPPPAGAGAGGMSLYASLLGSKSDSSASVSRTPAVFKHADGDTREDPATKKLAVESALRFQPIRRPQAKQKPKSSGPKPVAGAGITSEAASAASQTGPSPAASQAARSTLADWAAAEEDEYLYNAAGEKRQRGGRKQKRKKQQQQGQRGDGRGETDWDEIYDLTRPTNVEEYLRSDERIREVQEWKALLYAHRRRGTSGPGSGESDEEEDEGRASERPMNRFAPPLSYSFAPPPQSPPRGPTATVSDDATGDDAYARRMALSSMSTQGPKSPGMPAPPPPPAGSAPPPPPQPDEANSGATISRAPVRYNAPTTQQRTAASPDDMDIDEEEDDYEPRPAGLGTGEAEEGDDNHNNEGGDASLVDTGTAAPRTSRPGQAGFAQRLMSKYGWTKGSGLGADESGIVNPLRVQAEKRRKRPDSEGGGFAEPGGRGRIIGGTKRGRKGDAATGGGDDAEAAGGVGVMSDVIVMQKMLDGMEDLQGEISDGLGQEIGEECGEKYGRVERLYIDIDSRQVFIKFTDQVSALRAVNALQGRIFNGNAIIAKFFDSEKFEKGMYT